MGVCQKTNSILSHVPVLIMLTYIFFFYKCGICGYSYNFYPKYGRLLERPSQDRYSLLLTKQTSFVKTKWTVELVRCIQKKRLHRTRRLIRKHTFQNLTGLLIILSEHFFLFLQSFWIWSRTVSVFRWATTASYHIFAPLHLWLVFSSHRRYTLHMQL
jgi:hypothetical protein